MMMMRCMILARRLMLVMWLVLGLMLDLLLHLLLDLLLLVERRVVLWLLEYCRVLPGHSSEKNIFIPKLIYIYLNFEDKIVSVLVCGFDAHEGRRIFYFYFFLALTTRQNAALT